MQHELAAAHPPAVAQSVSGLARLCARPSQSALLLCMPAGEGVYEAGILQQALAKCLGRGQVLN